MSISFKSSVQLKGKMAVGVSTGVPCTVAPTSGLVAHWFDTYGGVDRVGGNNASYQGSGQTQVASNFDNGTALWGQGTALLQVDGGETNHDAFKTDQHTISAWYWIDPGDDGVPNSQMLVSNFARTDGPAKIQNTGTFLTLGFGVPRVQHVMYNTETLTDTNGYERTSYSAVADAGIAPIFRQWVNAVGVFDNTTNTSKIYVNGELKSSVTSVQNMRLGNYSDPTYYQIGGYRHPVTAGFFYLMDGYITNVRHYNRALSDTEIADLYNECKDVSF